MRTTVHSTDILLPMGESEPRYDSAILVDEEGRILAIDERARLEREFGRGRHHRLLMPGLVNAHVHLTDAGLQSTVPGGRGLPEWVPRLLAARASMGAATERQIGKRIDEMRGAGTVAIGEVCNDGSTVAGIATSGIRCRYIHELLAFHGDAVEAAMSSIDALPPLSETIHPALGIHAPYSVSPALARRAFEWSCERGTYLYQHLAEDPAERELYESAGGVWRSFLESIGMWDPAFEGDGDGVIARYDRLGILSDRYVGVHLTDARRNELATLGARRARVIFSPTSNLHITGRLPDYLEVLRQGIRFGFGTDGRGSNCSSDLVREARILLDAFPDSDPWPLLRGLSDWGAGILGFDDLGALSIGSAPGILSVDLPDLPLERGAIAAAVIRSEPSARHIVADAG